MIRLLHVSDLHVGHVPWWVGTSAPLAPGAVRKKTWWPSKRGHDERVAESLAAHWLTLRRVAQRDGDLARIVATGDLSRTGDDAELGCAARFLHATWTDRDTRTGKSFPPGDRLFGLGAGLDAQADPEAFTVPGNHDYWRGWLMNPSVDDSVLAPHFWPLPWVYRFVDPQDERLEVHLCGLDTLSGLGGLSLRQFFAKGAIARDHLELAVLRLDDARSAARDRGRLAELDVRVLRVVAMHHRIDDLADERWFERWLNDHTIGALLCGHSHEAGVATAPGTATLQAICGTSMQSGSGTRLPGLEENHLFVHALSLPAGRVPLASWHCTSWRHDGAAWAAHTHDSHGNALRHTWPVRTLRP